LSIKDVRRSGLSCPLWIFCGHGRGGGYANADVQTFCCKNSILLFFEIYDVSAQTGGM